MNRALTNEGAAQPAFVPINLVHLPFFLSPSITYFFISGRAQLLLTCCTLLSSQHPSLETPEAAPDESALQKSTHGARRRADMQMLLWIHGWHRRDKKYHVQICSPHCKILLANSFLLRDPTKTNRVFIWSLIHFLWKYLLILQI